ncbi:TBC1 domain family member 19 isoform X3 [Crocuta crocuta]
MLQEESDLSLVIAQIVQKLKGSNLYAQLERQAWGSWEKRILKSLNSMCTELSIPLARKRPVGEQKELLNKWNEMGTDEPDLSLFRPVYAPKDFLEVLINLRNPNYENGDSLSFRTHLGLIQVPLKVKDIPELSRRGIWLELELGSVVQYYYRAPLLHVTQHCAKYWGTNTWKRPSLCLFSELQKEFFVELGLTTGQLGIDDSNQVPPELFENEHVRIGQKVLAEQDSAAAQQYIRQGSPTALRAELWALILNISSQPEDILYYEQLKTNVIQHDLLVDSLIYKDVKLTASNDDYYFVFEDYLYQVLLCFSRDTSVLGHFAYNSASPPKSYIRGKLGLEEYAVFYPPNGVIPFHGFSMYVAPLCFLYHEPSKLYQIFREMYVRFFFRLHSISSHPSGIVSLCLLFETLLQTYLPQLFYHLREIGAQPLRISFKWMVRAFSGYLATDQLLLLWDRILGYNSLEILAVLAAAVFAFRAVNLMEVTSLAAAEAVLADLSTLKVMPLLQIFLFATVT